VIYIMIYLFNHRKLFLKYKLPLFAYIKLKGNKFTHYYLPLILIEWNFLILFIKSNKQKLWKAVWWIVHYLCESEKTQTIRLHFIDSLSSILLPDEMGTLLSHDSVTLTLRLLGAPLDPILDRTTELQFLHSSYTHSVHCLKAIFE